VGDKRGGTNRDWQKNLLEGCCRKTPFPKGPSSKHGDSPLPRDKKTATPPSMTGRPHRKKKKAVRPSPKKKRGTAVERVCAPKKKKESVCKKGKKREKYGGVEKHSSRSSEKERPGPRRIKTKNRWKVKTGNWGKKPFRSHNPTHPASEGGDT